MEIYCIFFRIFNETIQCLERIGGVEFFGRRQKTLAFGKRENRKKVRERRERERERKFTVGSLGHFVKRSIRSTHTKSAHVLISLFALS